MGRHAVTGIACCVLILVFYATRDVSVRTIDESTLSEGIDRQHTTRPTVEHFHIMQSSLSVQEKQTPEEERLDTNCKEKFNDTLRDNIDVLNNYPHTEADKYMWKLGTLLSTPLHQEKYPVLAMAFDRRHYQLARGLFHTFHEEVLTNERYGGNIKIIVYDLGITRRQKGVMRVSKPLFRENADLWEKVRKVQSFCRCEFRKFPFDEFPEHVRVYKYQAWKPLIIQMLLMEFSSVWWVDTSIRFLTKTVDGAFESVEKNGIVYSLDPDGQNKIGLTTHRGTFKFLGEDKCKFEKYSAADASSLIVRYTEETRVIIGAWARCALVKSCIAPDDSVRQCRLGIQENECQNYDQSVFSVLIRRLHHHRDRFPLHKVLDKYIINNMTDWDHLYFEECPDKFCLL